MYYYAYSFTNTELPLPYRYDSLMYELQEKYPRADFQFHYEEGKRGILHIHGMVASPHKIYRNRIDNMISHGKWNYDWGFVKNSYAWNAYMTKDTAVQDELRMKWINEQNRFWQGKFDECSTESGDSEEYIEIFKTDEEILREKLKNKRIV